jgi:hypothetical protein
MTSWEKKKSSLTLGGFGWVPPMKRLSDVRAAVWEMFREHHPHGASGDEEIYYKGFGENSTAQYPILMLLFKEFFAEYGSYAVLHVSFGQTMRPFTGDGTEVENRFHWTDKELFEKRGGGFLFINEQHVVNIRTSTKNAIVVRETQLSDIADAFYDFLSKSKIFGDRRVIVDKRTLKQVKGGCESMAMVNALLPNGQYASNRDGNLMKIEYVERIYHKIKDNGSCVSDMDDLSWKHEHLGIHEPWYDDSCSESSSSCEDDDTGQESEEDTQDKKCREEAMRLTMQPLVTDRMGRADFIYSVTVSAPLRHDFWLYRNLEFIDTVLDIMFIQNADCHDKHMFETYWVTYRTIKGYKGEPCPDCWPLAESFDYIGMKDALTRLQKFESYTPRRRLTENFRDYVMVRAAADPTSLDVDEHFVADYQDKSFMDTVLESFYISGNLETDVQKFTLCMSERRDELDADAGLDPPGRRGWYVPAGEEKYYEKYYGKPFTPAREPNYDREDNEDCERQYHEMYYRASFVPENEFDERDDIQQFEEKIARSAVRPFRSRWHRH